MGLDVTREPLTLILPLISLEHPLYSSTNTHTHCFQCMYQCFRYYQVIGLDMSWHDERAYKTADFMMNAAVAAAAATAAASSSIVKEEHKVEQAAGSSGHDSAGSSTVTTRGSVTVFDMTAWLKTGSGVGKITGRDTGTRVETGTRAVTESSGLAPVLDPTGLAPALGATCLAPVLGATGLAPTRVLEWKELDESKVTESNLV